MGDGDYGFDTNVLDIDNDAEEASRSPARQGFARAGRDHRRQDHASTARRCATPTPRGQPADRRLADALRRVTRRGRLAGRRSRLLRRRPILPARSTAARPRASARRPPRNSHPRRLRAHQRRRRRTATRPRRDRRRRRSRRRSPPPRSRAVLEEAFTVMGRGARADPPAARQPRPGDDRVVDTDGAILGLVRAPDAAGVRHRRLAAEGAHGRRSSRARSRRQRPAGRPERRSAAASSSARAHFLGDPAALTGKIAFGDRARSATWRGRISRRRGRRADRARSRGRSWTATVRDRAAGRRWCIATCCSTAVRRAAPSPTPRSPAPSRRRRRPARLQNGMQIFPGGVPIYRGGTLVGAIGVSGDGIDQDDMIGFLGLPTTAARAGRRIGNAPRRSAPIPSWSPAGAGDAAALRQLPVRAVPRHRRAERLRRGSSRCCEGDELPALDRRCAG